MLTLLCPGCNNFFTTGDVRQKRCKKNCGRTSQNTARTDRRLVNETHFIGIDGEGIGDGSSHRYVLLGSGSEQITNPEGLDYGEIFEFLYTSYQENRDSAFVGFFLGYDFTQWLKTMPMDRVWYLLSIAGKAARTRTNIHRHDPFPVEYKGWQFDILGDKRFKLRPKGDKHWLWICDTGPFFQTSLLNVINPESWPEPVCSEAEYALVLEGKSKRSTAKLDPSMRKYNALENDILARLMSRINSGFAEVGIRLHKNQWFGPGQAAQEWLKQQTADLKRLHLQEYIPPEVLDVARQSYYGGWFEITCHGHIPGITWEYDINSAYPYIISRLPCLEHGQWFHNRARDAHGTNDASGLRLVHAKVLGSNQYIGAMLHRQHDGRIARPWNTAGWYWQHELDAAVAAGLIDTIEEIESWYYDPCACPPPLAGLGALYEYRLQVGKDSPQGKGAKLIYNSVYGKFAQSVGMPIFGNAIYASLITSGCRTLILHAIASHPLQSQAVVMIATDGVYFTSPHPALPISASLGEWSVSEKHNLTLFKPGVYWDDKTRNQIRAGKKPIFKSRGVNATYFAETIAGIDSHFGRWSHYPSSDFDSTSDDREGWFPKVSFTLGFSMVTARQALQRGAWETAGAVNSDRPVSQDSDPTAKRRAGYRDGDLYRSRPWHDFGYGGDIASHPYDRRFGQELDPDEYGITPDGTVLDSIREILVR